jgi:hypothetical protein
MPISTLTVAIVTVVLMLTLTLTAAVRMQGQLLRSTLVAIKQPLLVALETQKHFH